MMNKKRSERNFLERMSDIAGKIIDRFKEIIDHVQDQILNLARNLENKLKDLETSKDKDMKKYTKIPIKDGDRKESISKSKNEKK